MENDLLKDLQNNCKVKQFKKVFNEKECEAIYLFSQENGISYNKMAEFFKCDFNKMKRIVKNIIELKNNNKTFKEIADTVND